MTTPGGNWIRLRVQRRVVECEDVVSLYLVADDGAALPAFRPGQFLTLRIPRADGKALPRTYSLSGSPHDRDCYRITVLCHRAPADRPDLPAGLGSSYVHEALREGATVDSLPPRGDFVLDEGSLRPVLLLAEGIGITPLAAMAQALARQGTRHVHLIHASEHGQVQPLTCELRNLSERQHRLRYITVLANRSAPDRQTCDFTFSGAVTSELLRNVLPIGDYDAYLCGASDFMQGAYRDLVVLGVREERIRYEFFGPAIKLSAAAPSAEPAATIVAPPRSALANGVPTVTFTRSGRTEAWHPGQRSLLDFAESVGLTPAFSCRNGICNTCICDITGAVRYVDDPLDTPPDGKALLCCSVPDGDITLDL